MILTVLLNIMVLSYTWFSWTLCTSFALVGLNCVVLLNVDKVAIHNSLLVIICLFV